MPARTPDEPRQFTVVLMRPIFQTTEVFVDADSPKEAAEIAFDLAAQLPESDWSGKFNRARYLYDIQGVVELNDDNEGEIVKIGEHTRYLLLRADLELADAEALIQPWLVKQYPLLITDLSQDWSTTLELLFESGIDALNEATREEYGPDNIVERGGLVLSFPVEGSEGDEEEE
jgi:hypothetical protein